MPSVEFQRLGIYLVGVPGLEPGKAGPESAVLPLHHTPIAGCISRNAGAKVLLFSEPAKLFGLFLLKYTKKISRASVFSD